MPLKISHLVLEGVIVGEVRDTGQVGSGTRGSGRGSGVGCPGDGYPGGGYAGGGGRQELAGHTPSLIPAIRLSEFRYCCAASLRSKQLILRRLLHAVDQEHFKWRFACL